MGSVVKTAAIVKPKALTRRKARPIRPPIVRSCERIATNKLTWLRANERKASTIIQPYSPIAYSLMKCHEGSSSGLMKCRAASKTTNVAAPANDRSAAVRETTVTGLGVAVSSVIRPSPYCFVICVFAGLGRPAYLTLIMVDRYPLAPGYTLLERVSPSSLKVPLEYAGEPFSPAQIVRASPSSS